MGIRFLSNTISMAHTLIRTHTFPFSCPPQTFRAAPQSRSMRKTRGKQTFVFIFLSGREFLDGGMAETIWREHGDGLDEMDFWANPERIGLAVIMSVITYQSRICNRIREISILKSERFARKIEFLTKTHDKLKMGLNDYKEAELYGPSYRRIRFHEWNTIRIFEFYHLLSFQCRLHPKRARRARRRAPVSNPSTANPLRPPRHQRPERRRGRLRRRVSGRATRQPPDDPHRCVASRRHIPVQWYVFINFSALWKMVFTEINRTHEKIFPNYFMSEFLGK